MDPELETRRSARLVIIDGRDRLLLFRYEDEHRAPFWSTVGGELRAGEDYVAAARREFAEETGFDAPIGELLHRREAVFAVARSTPARWIERYYLVECRRPGALSDAAWTDEERATIQAWRWWTLEEMRAAPSAFLPSCLPALLESALRRRAARAG